MPTHRDTTKLLAAAVTDKQQAARAYMQSLPPVPPRPKPAPGLPVQCVTRLT
ncbi:hypothetical protein [Hymenobacter sediminis]|uniref:hypothetical protein n=1 Tax=Hymenobacter sediminis TaxID=2218621 RepID=UPI00139050D5|nr:hypothetical protein [Hymenobacter sediminis]